MRPYRALVAGMNYGGLIKPHNWLRMGGRGVQRLQCALVTSEDGFRFIGRLIEPDRRSHG